MHFMFQLFSNVKMQKCHNFSFNYGSTVTLTTLSVVSCENVQNHYSISVVILT